MHAHWDFYALSEQTWSVGTLDNIEIEAQVHYFVFILKHNKVNNTM